MSRKPGLPRGGGFGPFGMLQYGIAGLASPRLIPMTQGGRELAPDRSSLQVDLPCTAR